MQRKEPSQNGPILVVDDNVDAAETLALLIESLGHEVIVAYDGPSALANVETYRPFLVFLDLDLPGLNGYEITNRIKANGPLKNTIVLALSGHGLPQHVAEARKAGCSMHLVKPVPFETIKQVIDQFSGPRR